MNPTPPHPSPSRTLAAHAIVLRIAGPHGPHAMSVEHAAQMLEEWAASRHPAQAAGTEPKEFYHCDGCDPSFSCWNTGAACRHPEHTKHAPPPSTPYPAPPAADWAKAAADDLRNVTAGFVSVEMALRIILRHAPASLAPASPLPKSDHDAMAARTQQTGGEGG